MPSWRNKPTNRQYFNKRHTPEQQQALHDAAKAATQRLYCDAVEFWRGCADRKCRRHLRCMGKPAACLRRGWPGISERRRRRAFRQVLEGGVERIPPANHKEWEMRRTPPSTIAG